MLARTTVRIRAGKDIRNDVSTTSDGALAGAAVPDTGRVTTDGNLSAESAGVLGVLGDLHLLHLLTEGSTVTNTKSVFLLVRQCFRRAIGHEKLRLRRVRSLVGVADMAWEGSLVGCGRPHCRKIPNHCAIVACAPQQGN